MSTAPPATTTMSTTAAKSSTADDDDRAALLRRLQWRSRRGTLELDLTLERFWRDRGDRLSTEELSTLADLLNGDDEEVARAFAPGGIFG